MAAPVAQERLADVMAGLSEEATAGLGGALRKSDPITALLAQAIRAKAAKQDIVGAYVLGVQLQAVALELLDLQAPFFDQLLVLRADREAEDRQTAVLLPEVANASAHALASF